MKYLTEAQILLIHSIIIDETGGMHGIRDRRALLSLENAPRQKIFGKELYLSMFEKAAIYARDIIMNHPFLDGNKRTGMASAAVFLEHNGHVLEAREGEIEAFAVRIIRERLEIRNIAAWLKKRAKKSRR